MARSGIVYTVTLSELAEVPGEPIRILGTQEPGETFQKVSAPGPGCGQKVRPAQDSRCEGREKLETN